MEDEELKRAHLSQLITVSMTRFEPSVSKIVTVNLE